MPRGRRGRCLHARGGRRLVIGVVILTLVGGPKLSAGEIPLLPVQHGGIDATTDRTIDCVLPAGVTLTGAVTTETDAPIIGGNVTARSADVAFEGAIQFSPLTQSSRYEIALLPGHYRLTVRAIFVVEDTGTTLTVTFPESDEITVTGDTVHDLRVGPPPPVVRVHGRVQNIGDLDVENAVLAFTSEDGRVQSAIPLAEDYLLALPVGRYVVSALGLRPNLPDDLSELLNVELAVVTISGDTAFDVALPPLVEVKGLIQTAEGEPGIPAQITVLNVDQPATRAAVAILTDGTAGRYMLRIPAGTYEAIALVSLAVDEEGRGVLGFPLPARQFLARAGAELHFTVPRRGPVVTISGRVTDARGNPVAGAFVLASGTMLTDMPDSSFTAAVLSDNEGTYQIKVIGGRDYTLVCSPPVTMEASDRHDFSVARSFSSSVFVSEARIEPVVQSIADDIEGHDRRHDGQAGEDDQMRCGHHVGAPAIEHLSPTGHRFLHAEAEKAQSGFGQNGSGHPQRRLNDERLNDVRQNMDRDQPRRARAQGPRCLDEIQLLHFENLATHQPGITDPADGTQGQNEIGHARTEKRDQSDGQQNAGKGQKRIEEKTGDDAVEPSAVIAREGADDRPEDRTDGDHRHADAHRDASAKDQPREHISPELIAPQRMGE